MKDLKIYYATDIHGSEKCFKKFIKSGQFYDCDVVIMGGDITGKGIITFIKNETNGSYIAEVLGQKYNLITEKETSDLEQLVLDIGLYPYRTTQEEVDYIAKDATALEDLYIKLSSESMQKWLEMIAEFNKDKKYTYYITPGNDDAFEIDKVLNQNNSIINPEGKMVCIKDELFMISSGYSNETPFNTKREKSEQDYKAMIDELMQQVPDKSRSVFNFHVPPYKTNLDVAPFLDSSLQQKADMGQVQMANVGSKAVRDAIMEYQPLFGVHGHIHESRATQKLGKTVCFNPGSEYAEGILRGIIIVVGNGGLFSSKKICVKNYMHVSG
jgi:Icc-related predicted phosphoesterase